MTEFRAEHQGAVQGTCQNLPVYGSREGLQESQREHFGNEFNEYIGKALSCSPIEPEDSKALEAFALYIRGACNAMEDIAYIEELGLASNLKCLATRLPFKLHGGGDQNSISYRKGGTARQDSFIWSSSMLKQPQIITMNQVKGGHSYQVTKAEIPQQQFCNQSGKY